MLAVSTTTLSASQNPKKTRLPSEETDSVLSKTTRNRSSHRFLDKGLAAAFAIVCTTTVDADNDEVLRTITLPTVGDNEIAPVADRATRNQITRSGELIKAVKALGALELGWHSEDSKPASARALLDAEAFLRAMPWDELRLPKISLAEDGEINFFWGGEDFYLDLGFFGDGFYSFYAALNGGQSIVGDDVPIDDSDMLALIKSWLGK